MMTKEGKVKLLEKTKEEDSRSRQGQWNEGELSIVDAKRRWDFRSH